MANHLRRQIREAAGTALTGLSTTGANVFQSRVRPVAENKLPCLLISSEEESSDMASIGYPRLMQRSLTLSVKAVAKATANLDDTLDQICKEVEVALAADPTLGGVAKDLRLAETRIGIDAESDKPVGVADMLWQADYYTTENAPDVAR